MSISDDLSLVFLFCHMRVIDELPYQDTLLDMEYELPSLDFVSNSDSSAGHPFSPKNKDNLFDRIGHLKGDGLPGSFFEPVVEG